MKTFFHWNTVTCGLCVVTAAGFTLVALFLVHGTVFNSLGTAAFGTMHNNTVTQIYANRATPYFKLHSPEAVYLR
jgi:hypothetical protein